MAPYNIIYIWLLLTFDKYDWNTDAHRGQMPAHERSRGCLSSNNIIALRRTNRSRWRHTSSGWWINNDMHSTTASAHSRCRWRSKPQTLWESRWWLVNGAGTGTAPLRQVLVSMLWHNGTHNVNVDASRSLWRKNGEALQIWAAARIQAIQQRCKFPSQKKNRWC